MSETIKEGTPDALWLMRCTAPTPTALATQLGVLDSGLYQDAGVWLRTAREHHDPMEPGGYGCPPRYFCRHGGSAPVIWARASGQDTRVVGLTWTDELQAIVALPGSGIRHARDLRGRRLGLPRHDIPLDYCRAAALRGYESALALEGIGLHEVELVDLPDHPIPALVQDGQIIGTGSGRRGRYSYSSEIHALVGGLVDAIYIKDARGAQAAHALGAILVADIGFHPDPEVRINNGTPRPLIVSRALLEACPHAVDCLVDIIRRTGEQAMRDPAQTLTMLARESGWAESWLRYAHGDNLHRQLRLDLEDGTVAALGHYKNFLLRHGFLPADFALGDWIAPGPLQRSLARAARASGTAASGLTPSCAPPAGSPRLH